MMTKAPDAPEVDAFEPGPVFQRLRTSAFSIIMFVCFVWTVLLFVEMYVRWNVSDGLQRGMVLVLSIINAGTVIMLIALVILPFRVWLDAARLALLIVAHGGMALGFTVWIPKFTCPNAVGPDGEATCRLLNMYILLASWVVPALLFVYAACLTTAYYVYRKRLLNDQARSSVDLENGPTSRGSVLPFMHPPPSSAPSTTTFLGPIHQSLPPPGPIYPSGPPSGSFYLSAPPSGPNYQPSGSSVMDRRISTNPTIMNRRMSTTAYIMGRRQSNPPMPTSDSPKRTSRTSKHYSMTPSVAVPPLSAVTDERRRKDSFASVSEYSQNSRSSGRVTLTKPMPLAKFEHAF